MPVLARPPDTSAVNPRRQCGGDWVFWHSAALEFLEDADSRLQDPLEGEKFAKMAHSLKTGAELLAMSAISLAAFELENGAKNEMDEAELLQLQIVLMERVVEMRSVLESPDFRASAHQLLEGVGGRFDLVLTPSGKLKEDCSHSGVNKPAAALAMPAVFPSRVAVVASDATTRRLVAAAVTNGSQAELATYSTLAETAADSASVVVVCISQDTPLVRPQDLPRAPASGQLRAFVFVGDMDDAAQEHVHEAASGWCETVRMPLAPGELVRRISSVHAASQR